MAGTLVSASTGVMESLLCKLSSMLESQYRRNKRVEKDVLFLRNELSSMNALMQKHAMSEESDSQLKAWMKEVRELAYDIEDVIDAFIAQVEEKPGQATGIKGFIVNSIKRLKDLVSSSTIAEEIEELKNQVIEMSDRKKRYKLDMSISKDTNAAIDPRLPALYADVSGLVGVDGPKSKIIKMLTEDDADSRFGKQLKLVSIVGFGGLGKTTLAIQVYQKIKGQFDCTCFVSVSQRPHIKKILADLLVGLGSADSIWDDEHQLINRIREFLCNKRYLIVIDDIWTITAWEILKCVLLENGLGSRIITTTRIFDIAKSCCCCYNGHIYHIEPLSDTDSRKLFLKRIFHAPDSCPSHLEDLSAAILRKCGGLPLAILHMACLLATKSDTKDEWELVLNSVGSALENNHTLQGMKKILLLSFYDLPPHLKTCLLYLSIYPEDYKIPPRSLIRRWIAEGFIAEERGKRLDQVAQSYMSDLINRSMIIPMYINIYGGPVFQVHDMVLSVIKSLSAEENFVTVVDGQQSIPLPKRIRRLSLQFNDSKDAVIGTAITSHKYIRSLTIFGFTKQLPSFSNHKALRVLDLGYCEFLENHHIECVGSMLQLRYLVLHSNFITELPDQIGNLQHLELLNVKFCSIQGLPVTVVQLRKLVCLYVSLVKLPDRFGNMQLIEELAHILLSNNSIQLAEELGCLRKLRRLTATVEDPSEMEDHGRRYKEVLLSSIYQLVRQNLESLSLDYRGPEDFIQDSSMGSCFALQSLQDLSIMKTLSRVPKWMSRIVNLTRLELYITRMEASDIDIVKGISTLLFLRLVFTGYAPCGRIIIDDQGFQRLTDLYLLCFIPGMWLVFSPGAMPKLQRYHLTFKLQEPQCNSDDFNFGLEHLASLQHVSVVIVPTGADNVGISVVETAIRNATNMHSNQPTVQIDTWQ